MLIGGLSRFSLLCSCSFKRARVEFSQRFLRNVRLLSQISDLTIKPRSLDVSAAHSAGYPNRICVVVEQT